jgi:hypothetical protein
MAAKPQIPFPRVNRVGKTTPLRISMRGMVPGRRGKPNGWTGDDQDRIRKITVSTMKAWLKKYRRGEFDALKPKNRSDGGRPKRFHGGSAQGY